MTISSINALHQNGVDQAFGHYNKNVLGEDIDESIFNPVDKVEISDEAFRAAQAEAEAKRNAMGEDTTETVGSVTIDKLTHGQRTAAQQPGTAEINDIVAEPVTATLSGGSTVTVYGQSREDENGSGTRLMARIDSVNGDTYEFEVTESTIISEDESGNITVKEFMQGAEQSGTANNDVIISFGGGNINAGDGDDTIMVFDIDRNLSVVGGTNVEITGGAGNDTVIAGNLYASTVYMGDGNNSFTAKSLNTGTQVSAGNGNNAISIEKSNYAYVNLGSGNNTYRNKQQFATHMTTGNGNNSISIGNLGLGSIRTGNGNDSITVGYAVQSSIKTGGGDDTVTLSRVNDTSVEWEGFNPGKVFSNMLLDMGTGNNALKLLENVDKLSVYTGKDGSTLLTLGLNATLTNEMFGGEGNIMVEREKA